MITAWTALLHATGRAARVPSDPEYDLRGLRMEIVF
jgi:predicted RNase H-like nuclease